MSENQTPDQLQYPWPPNLAVYEAKLFFGLTAQETIAIAMGVLLPTVLMRSLGGFVLGVMLGALVLLAMKKLDALGGVSLPMYVIYRLLAWRRQETIELPLIMGSGGQQVEVEDWDGETLMVIGEAE